MNKVGVRTACRILPGKGGYFQVISASYETGSELGVLVRVSGGERLMDTDLSKGGPPSKDGILI